MRRWLHKHRTVSGAAGELEHRLVGDLHQLLVDATASPPGPPAGDGSFRVLLPAQVLGAEVTKAVRVTTGVAVSDGPRLRVPIAWQADPARRAFPTFEGTIELEPLDPSRAQLAVVGAYTVPAGVAGLLADVTLLRGVAESTAARILDGLAAALSAPRSGPRQPVSPASPMRVADVMTPDPLVLAHDQPLRTAALLLFHYGVGGAPVVDDRGGLLGVLSEADLVERQARPRTGRRTDTVQAWRRHDALTVGEVASRPARVTSPDVTVRDAAREMVDHKVARLVVIDDSRIAGIVTRHDVLLALVRADAAIRLAVEEVLRRHGEPELAATVDWGIVALHGTISRLSRINGLVAAIEDLDGVMAVDAYHLDWYVDDVEPLTIPMT